MNAVKGNTIHSALAIPACQLALKGYKPVDSSRLNTFRCQLGGVKLIFIDEITMVGITYIMYDVQMNKKDLGILKVVKMTLEVSV